MKANIYKTKLDENKHPYLVKEKDFLVKKSAWNKPEVIAEMMKTLFDAENLAEEHLFMVSLGSKSELYGIFEISHGTVNMSIANPRDMFIKAMLSGAVNIVLVHNHPSGDPTPSNEDDATTKRVHDAGKLLGIDLLDHIIIGDHERFFSYRKEKGYIFYQ